MDIGTEDTSHQAELTPTTEAAVTSASAWIDTFHQERMKHESQPVLPMDTRLERALDSIRGQGTERVDTHASTWIDDFHLERMKHENRPVLPMDLRLKRALDSIREPTTEQQ